MNRTILAVASCGVYVNHFGVVGYFDIGLHNNPELRKIPPIRPLRRSIQMTKRFPFSILIAVACFIVIWLWGEPIVGWLTR